MTADLLVGIDLGTSSVKAAVTNLAGDELSQASAALRWTRVETGAETAFPALRKLALAVVADALSRVPAGAVLAVGVTGMAEAGVVLDSHGIPLTPIIAWHDTRGREDVERVAAELGEQRFVDVTGLPLSATPTIIKLAWLKRSRMPLAGGNRWLGIPEALVHSMGGAPIADLSLACRTGLLDLDQATWWSGAVEWLGAPQALLSELVVSGTRVGSVQYSPEVPERLHGAALAVAGHDHLTAAFGAGAVDPGDMFDSCGTAEALVRSAHPVRAESRSLAVADGLSVSWHVLPGVQALVAASPTGLFLTSVLQMLGRTAPDERRRLDRDTASSVADAGQLRFGAIASDGVVLSGITSECSPEHVWRAAIQCAASELGRLLGIMEQHGGAWDRLIATGGWTRSQPLLSAKVQRCGPVLLPMVRQAGARGAALMGGVAAGCYGTALAAPPPKFRRADERSSRRTDPSNHGFHPIAQLRHGLFQRVPGTKERSHEPHHP